MKHSDTNIGNRAFPDPTVPITFVEELGNSSSKQESAQDEQLLEETSLENRTFEGDPNIAFSAEDKNCRYRKRKRMQPPQIRLPSGDSCISEQDGSFSCISSGYEDNHDSIDQMDADGYYKMKLDGRDGHYDTRSRPRIWPYDSRIKEEELVRILIQSLKDMGYHRSAKTLEEESRFLLEDKTVENFREGVIHGDWDRVRVYLNLRISSSSCRSEYICACSRTHVHVY
jgi:hypothetical protein